MEGIKAGALVYLDTNVLIYLTEGKSDQHTAPVEELFQKLDATGAKFITSDLALGEVLVHPLRTNNDTLVGVYESLFTDFVEAQPITREALYLSAKLRAETPSQRMPDAIHVATAMLAKADVFVTGDKGIKNVPDWMTHLVV